LGRGKKHFMPAGKNRSHRLLRALCASVALSVLVAAAHAQDSEPKNEVGLVLGVTTTPDREVRPQVGTGQPPVGTARVDRGLTFGATYARRLAGNDAASLHFEVALFATPSTNVNSSFTFLPRNYAALFLTPGLKLKFFPRASVSPYVVAGGGYGRFDESEFQVNDAPNRGERGTNTGVFDYGGGVEVKVFRFLAVRGEVRDFVSGNPKFNAIFSGSRQHNVITSGGLVLRF
jgi:opacity protein-like surface antigen